MTGPAQASVGATVPIHGQLARLDRLVAWHETYWAAVAQQNPRSVVMREFLRRQWDPWFARWLEIRPQIDSQSTDAIASFVHESAQDLSGLRERAAQDLIPTPDLGTAQHGFASVSGGPIAYKKVTWPAAQGTLDPRAVATNRGSEALRASDAEIHSAAKVSGDEGERDMSAHDYVGSDGHSYPEIAARAVMSIQHQNPSPVYGYLRTGPQQKIYLFHALEDAHGWFAALTQVPSYDYAAVFAAADLSRPVLESFGHTAVSGDPSIGAIWPFLLGLPAGALGGYYLRKWQEMHPGQAVPGIPPGTLPAPSVPKTSGWYDVDDDDGEDDEPAYTIGGPWVDLVGSQMSQLGDYARRQAWPQTRALIQSAIREVTDAAGSAPAEAYVWSLDPPGASPLPQVELTSTSLIVPFASAAQALDYMRDRIQTPHVALALFDRTSPHWPNPTNWTKSNDPAYEPAIVQQIAKVAPTRAAGAYVGAYPTSIGSALDDVRTRAQSIANKRAGNVVGVIHTTKDGLWHALAFRDADDADDWLGTATSDAAAYTYAAYYDKNDYAWPHPVNEKIGGSRVPSRPGAPIPREIATTSGHWRS